MKMELIPVIRLSGPSMYALRIWHEDATGRGKPAFAMADETEIGVLRSTADALEHYGSWEALEAAVKEAAR